MWLNWGVIGDLPRVLVFVYAKASFAFEIWIYAFLLKLKQGFFFFGSKIELTVFRKGHSVDSNVRENIQINQPVRRFLSRGRGWRRKSEVIRKICEISGILFKREEIGNEVVIVCVFFTKRLGNSFYSWKRWIIFWPRHEVENGQVSKEPPFQKKFTLLLMFQKP